MREPGNGAEKSDLHIHGHAGGHALHVDFPRMKTLRLQKELMPLLIGKAQDLRLDGGTVARAHALDDAVCHGSPLDILP